MVFKDNFTETHLLFAEPVHFTVYENEKDSVPLWEFYLNVPTFGHFYFNDNFRSFVGLINAPISNLQQQFPIVQGFKTHYELLDGLILMQNKYTNRYLDIVCLAISSLGVNFEIKGEGWRQMYINNNVISAKLFERICAIILISLALKKQSDFIDDPVMREMQEKINRIKQNNKAIKGADNGNFHDAFMILTYEFGYKPTEIYNMTQYAINLILGYTNKSIRYKLSLIAAGNGNTKKVKFITDKGNK